MLTDYRTLGLRLLEILSREATFEASPLNASGVSRTEAADWWRGADEARLGMISTTMSLDALQRLVRAAESAVRVFADYGGTQAHGAGFLIHPKVVVTCDYLAIRPELGSAVELSIELNALPSQLGFVVAERRKPATLLSHDRASGIAFLSIPHMLVHVEERLPQSVVVNDPLIQIALDGVENTLRFGAIAAHVDEDRIQYVSGPGKGGVLGGVPIVDYDGRVVAMQYGSRTRDEVTQNEAIRIEVIRQVWRRLTGERPT